MPGPFDGLPVFGPLGRTDETPNVGVQASDHDAFAVALDALRTAGISLEALVMYGANSLAELTDYGIAQRRLSRQHRIEGLVPLVPLTNYSHSYGGSLNPSAPASYVSSIRAYYHARVAQRLGLPLIPPYYFNYAFPAERLAQTFGVMNSIAGGLAGLNWSWVPGTATGIVIIDSHRNDAANSAYNSPGADTSAYQDQLRTCLRLLRAQTTVDDTALTSVGTWGRTSDLSMASAGGQATCGTGDVTTNYKSFIATATEHHVVAARFNQGSASDGVLRITDHTAADVTLVDFSVFAGGFPPASGPTFAEHAIRLTGLTPGHEIRMGRAPATGGTVYVDQVLTPYPGDGPPVLVVVVKDPLLVNWFGTNFTVGYQNLWAAIDTVLAEPEFAPFCAAAAPGSYGWDGKMYSTVETSTAGRNGCIGDDGSLIHPNDHGQLVIADAVEAAIALSPWTRGLGNVL